MGSKQGGSAPRYGGGMGQPGRKQGGQPPQYGWGGPQQPQFAQPGQPQQPQQQTSDFTNWMNTDTGRYSPPPQQQQQQQGPKQPGEDWFQYHERVGTGQPGGAQQPKQPGEDWFQYHERVGTPQQGAPPQQGAGGAPPPQGGDVGIGDFMQDQISGGPQGWQQWQQQQRNPLGNAPAMTAETRAQELVDQRGMSMEDATAQNTSAVNQGADFNADGSVSNAEWSQFQNPQQQQGRGGKKQGGRPPMYGGGGYGPPPPSPYTQGPAGMPFKSGADYIAPYGRGGYFNQGGQQPFYGLGMYGSPRGPTQPWQQPAPYPQPEAGTGYGGAQRNPFANMPGYGSAPFSGSDFAYMDQGQPGGYSNPGYFGAFG